MESKPVKIEGRSVVLVDTPGFDDTLESDMVILARIAAYLEKMSVYIYIYQSLEDIRHHLPTALLADIVKASNFMV